MTENYARKDLAQLEERKNDTKKTYRSLGPLEALLMDVIWSSVAPLSVQEIIDKLGDGHNYKTAMTVLNRLVDKQLLARVLKGRAYRYYATETKQKFLAAVAESLVYDYVNLYGESAAEYLANVVDGQRQFAIADTSDSQNTSLLEGIEVEKLKKHAFVSIILAIVLLQVISSIFRPSKKRK
tara:strand:+ start:22191 stop:22736 length:546 start_codon:yes stop_codon:yes gene_type:complete